MISNRRGATTKKSVKMPWSLPLLVAALIMAMMYVSYLAAPSNDASDPIAMEAAALAVDVAADLTKAVAAHQARSRSDKQRDKIVHLKQGEVTCGTHKAKTCGECPQGHGQPWCNGDCHWCRGGSICVTSHTQCPAAEQPKQSAGNKSVGPVWKPPKAEPWFTPPVPEDYNHLTLSIILPCGSEHEFFERTIQSVFAATPPEVLKEIIVVDDNSDPPLEPLLKLDADEFKVKFLRNEGVTLGLMTAKHQGAQMATGDIIVFLDCHVKPALGYWAPFVEEISQHPKRVVVPMITNLDVLTWDESGRKKDGMSKCYLTFDSDFKWTTDETPYIPIMSGGLLALRRDWFFELGGHDQEMKGWGGENLDLSLRIWRCGGSIVSAPTSYVAHMWRDASKKATQAKYIISGGQSKGEQSRLNRARAFRAHAPAFFDQKTTTFPSFAKWKDKGDELNVTSITKPIEHLHCKDFSWYLDFFSHIYRDAGYIPDQVFSLTPDGGVSCLALGRLTWGNAQMANDVLVLKPCRSTSTQYWHRSNRDKKGECCSGLRAWNTDQCMMHSRKTGICTMTSNQPASLAKDGKLRVVRNCLTVVDGTTLGEVDCHGETTTWEKVNAFAPPEYLLLNSATKE